MAVLDMHLKRLNSLDLECIAEIKRTLNKYRFDPFYRGKGNRVPLQQFADYCAVSRQTLYDLVRGDRKGIEPATRDRILAAIELVKNGLRFERVVVRKAVVERRIIEPGIVEWRAFMPNGQPAPPMPQRHQTEKQIAARKISSAKMAAAARRRHPVTVVSNS